MFVHARAHALGCDDGLRILRVEQEGRKLSPEADRATLLRRVTLDLTG